MILVLFEVTMKPGGMDAYLAEAAALKDSLANAEGFVRSERFSSITNEGKLLSMSVWESEEAVAKWRNHHMHRKSQMAGRRDMFAGYRITVVSALRSYTDTDRRQAPEDSIIF